MWEQLYECLVADKGRDIVRPSEETIDTALTRAETDLDFRFPTSYKAFIHQFGPGELAGFFRIFGPTVPGCRDYGNNIVKDNLMWRGPGALSDSGQPELVKRLVVFSTTGGGDAFFWDPVDKRHPRKREYGIYILSHGSMDMKVKFAAGSFKEFVEVICLGNGFARLIGGKGWGENGPEQCFYPTWRSRKSIRKK